jgi:Domain of unknown function (DUF4349)
MEPFKDDTDLTAELRALRPKPRPAFAAELDERAAAGFPRRSPQSASLPGRIVERLRATKPRRALIPAGATALAAIAAATVVVAVSEPQDGAPSLARLSAEDGATLRPFAGKAKGSGFLSFKRAVKPGAGEGSSGVIYKSGAASAEPLRSTQGFNLSFDASGRIFDASGPYAAQAKQREVERSAEMVLGADPEDVAGDAAEVFDAVHAVDGIVLSSSVSGGAEGEAGARFDLLIPAAKLGDALADFSAIGTVVSRHEATDDITAPTVAVGERLRDSRARIDGLLMQLAGADSDEERAEVEVELAAERRHAAALRSRATKLDRRANLSRVSLRIVTDPAATSSDRGGGWGIGDAFDDAGHILAIAAGVTIVALAILGPLALIALLAWLANRARIRRGRERALA